VVSAPLSNSAEAFLVNVAPMTAVISRIPRSLYLNFISQLRFLTSVSNLISFVDGAPGVPRSIDSTIVTLRSRYLDSYFLGQALADFGWEPVMHMARAQFCHINHRHWGGSGHGHDEPD